MALSIGIDIGGTNLRVGVFSDLHLIQETRFQADFSQICKENTPTGAWQKILIVTSNAIQSVLAKYPDVQGIGIGFPGFIDPATQLIAQSPNLPGLKNVNLAADLSKCLTEIYGKKVFNFIVENDANVAAYGEYCLLGKPETGLIYVGLGTGVGGGLIHTGKVFAGFHGCAMEVGHIIIHAAGRQCGCGSQGCLEQYASATGVSISYFEASKQNLTAHQIAELARKGDAKAQAAYSKAGEALATALAHVLKVLDVPNIVIGGGMSGAWDLMQSAFDARLEADLIPVLRGKIKVTISNSGDQAGILGAALLTML